MFGWAGNQVDNLMSAQSAPAAVVAEVNQPLAHESHIEQPSILEQQFKFNEQGSRVRQLQKAIGTVRVDGIYGAITRREHIQKLQALGLPTDNVPVKEVRYNISYDLSERCPKWEPLFEQVGLEPVEVFSYLAFRESHCNPESQNATWKNGKMTYHLNSDGSYDTGLLQINSSWKTVTEQVCGEEASSNHMAGLKDPMCSVRVAKYIMDNSRGKLANWKIYKD
jgi:hypothetical protein